MNVLGVGGIGSDAALAVLRGGELVAAVEEKKVRERSALETVLRLAGLSADEIHTVAVARPVDAAHVQDLRRALPESTMKLVGHHSAHAASAFFASGYGQASVLVLDSGSDLTAATLWRGAEGSLALQREQQIPDAIADLYSRVTQLLGYDARADEHKVQWLSTQGDARFKDLFLSMLGGPWSPLDRSYYSEERVSRGRFGAKFYAALGVADGAAIPEALRAHVAAGLQQAVAETVMAMVEPGGNLCLAGGLFFNALLVRELEACGRWENVFVQPAAGNAGTAIGAAYLASTDARQPLRTLALGPSYRAEEVKQVLENCKLRFRYMLTTEELTAAALEILRDNEILGWMQGPMEFGPRALGQRSILASPLDPYAGENLNVFIKHREGFRKFAAAVPAERASEYFDIAPNARFLSTVARVKPAYRETFAGALLGGDLIRVHTVDRADNPLFHLLLTEFGAATGLPVLYNTSFNLFGDPLVCTPRDAVRSFYSSGIDSAIIGNFVIEK